jgi:hypothetical protein
MENRKDIGKAISEKLESLDKTPNERVWIGINEEIQKKKKKKRFAFFFFWTKTLGLFFAGSLIALYIFTQNDRFDFSSPNNQKDRIITDPESEETNPMNPNNIKNNHNQKIKNVLDNKTTEENYNSKENNNPIDKSVYYKNFKKSRYSNSKRSSEIISTKNNSKKSFPKSVRESSKLKSKITTIQSLSKRRKNKSNNKQTKLLSPENNPTKKDSVLYNLTELQNQKSIASTTENKSKKSDSIFAKKGKEKPININMYPKDSLKTEQTKTYRKFYIDAFISPTHYGYFNKGSLLDRDLDSRTKKSEIKFSYGLGVTYDFTETISIRVGYSKVKLNYITKNAPIGNNTPEAMNFTGITYNTNTSNATIFAASNGSEKMDITQNISYTEIPIEIKYQFLNKKIGLKSCFGFSYLMLEDNKVSVRTLNGYTQDIGKTKDLSEISFSVNVGVEIDYLVFKNTKIFVEPLLNYQVKAFATNNSQPYIFGIHTGIRYSINNK